MKALSTRSALLIARQKSLLHKLAFAISTALGLVAIGPPLAAGTFHADFESPDPSGFRLNGGLRASGQPYPVIENGYLVLTYAENGQQGTIVLDEIDPGVAVQNFVADFKVRLGGGSSPPADGFAFWFGTEFDPASTFGEEGPPGNGITFCFDTYDNGGGEAPAVDLKINNVLVASRSVAINDLLTTDFVPVHIELKPGGLVDVVFNGKSFYSNFPIGPFAPLTGARFAIGARTGGLNENLWVDDLSIQSGPRPGAYASAPAWAREGTVVELDGTFSNSSRGPVTFAWSQTSGPAVNLSDSTAAQPTFVAPAIWNYSEPLTFQLTIDDGQGQPDSVQSTSVTVRVINGFLPELQPLSPGPIKQMLHLGASSQDRVLEANVSRDYLQPFGGEPNVRPAQGDPFDFSGSGIPTSANPLVWTSESSNDLGFFGGPASLDEWTMYWQIYLISPAAREGRIIFRHDDHIRVWNNGLLAASRDGWDEQQDRTADFPLNSGSNALLFRLNEGVGGNYLRAQFTDPDGEHWRDLLFTLSPPTVLGDAYAARILPDGFQAGTEVAVTLSLRVNPAGSPASATVTETIPEGWTVVDAAGATQVNQTLQWTFAGAELHDRQIVYRLRAPENPGATAQFNGSTTIPSGEFSTLGLNRILLAPDVPQDLRVQMFLSAYLNWAPEPGLELLGYHVYRSTDNGPFEKIGFTTSSNFNDRSVVADRVYRYRVARVNIFGQEGAPSEPSAEVKLQMQSRQIVEYNHSGGQFPGFKNGPSGVEAPSSGALGSQYDYFYQHSDYTAPPNPFRPDSMIVVDDDPDPAKERYVVAWTFAGDWWRYSFDVPADGWVKLVLRAATPGVTPVRVFWDESLVGTFVCHSKDWGDYQDFPLDTPFFTTAGRHTLRLEMGSSANLMLFGYEFGAPPPTRRTIFQESFEAFANAASLQTDGGWNVFNGSGFPDASWRIQNARFEPRTGIFSGMTERFAYVDAGANPRARIDESLISPTIDCRDFSGLVLEFNHELKFNSISDSQPVFEVALDTFDENAGAWANLWVTVFRRTRAEGDLARREAIDLSPYADGKRIRLRWRYAEAKYDFWWAVDHVEVIGNGTSPLSIPAITSVQINHGATVVTDREVLIQTSADGHPAELIVSERDDFADARWQLFSSNAPFTLSPAPGEKTVFVKVKNGAGSSSAASVKVNFTPAGPALTAIRKFSAGASFPPQSMEVVVEVNYHGAEPPTFIELEERLPVGWVFESIARGPQPSVAPVPSNTGNLLFRWNEIPLFPFALAYRVRFASEQFTGGELDGEVRLQTAAQLLTADVSGESAPQEQRNNMMFHRFIYGAQVISTEEWDWMAHAGMTVVQSYGGDPYWLRQMMDEAHKRGIKMMGATQPGEIIPWLRLSLNTGAEGAPASLRFDVRHHYTEQHGSLVFFANADHPLNYLRIGFDKPECDTIGELAAYLNQLGYGLSAQVEPGKENMKSDFLGTGSYGELVNGASTLVGNELVKTYREYVNVIKDHPALFALVPFDEPDLRYTSPAFERYLREKVREWAPGVPVYLLVLESNPGTFSHDHRMAWDAFDGIIHDMYPAILPEHADVIRGNSQNWWALHQFYQPKDWLLLVKAFAFTQDNIPPKGGITSEWEAAERSGLPFTGFGYYTFHGHEFNLSGVRSMQQETIEVNRRIQETYFDVRIDQDTRRAAAANATVQFTAKAYGGKPPLVYEWDFGDGQKAFGATQTHTFQHPGSFIAKVTVLDSQGATAVRETPVHVLGSLAPSATENFDDGLADQFINFGGEWTVTGGQLSPSELPAGLIWSYIETGLANGYSFDVDLNFKSAGGEAVILWSGATQNADARLTWSVPSQPEFTLKGTSLLQLHAAGSSVKAYWPFDKDHTYRVTVDVLPTAVLVSIDGKVVLEKQIGGLPADATVGLGANQTLVAWDNFTLAPVHLFQAHPSLTSPEPTSAPFNAQFAANVTGGRAPLVYEWNFGDGSTSSLADPQHEFATAGAWNVQLKVTDADGQVATGNVWLLTGATTFYREAEDYDWTDGSPPGYPTQAEFGVRYGAGQDGRKRVDFYQQHLGRGDQLQFREDGAVSLETGTSDTGINIRDAGATDWWNYTFKFPSAGLARIRAYWTADNPPRLAACRVTWKGKHIGDLVFPASNPNVFSPAETPLFPVDATAGQIQFHPLDWGLSFARFEVEFVSSADADGDGIPDVADLDSDNDRYLNTDEASGSQSDPLLGSSRPIDSDGDLISDANDADDDNDGVADAIDPFPLTPNRPPIFSQVGDQVVRAQETLSIQFAAIDVELPPQNVTFNFVGEIPAGATLTAGGLFTWTPGTGQAPNEYSITIAATDNGTPALASTKTIRVRVDESLDNGFEAVRVETSKGPVTVVMPRRHYEFQAQKQTYYLALDGSDANDGSLEKPWRTFPHALGRLTPGDVLFVRGGDYYEPFEVRLRGTKSHPIIISAAPGERVRVLQPEGWQETRTQNSATIELRDCAYVWLHGFEVEGGRRPDQPVKSGYGRSCIWNSSDVGVRILNNLCRWGIEHGIQSSYNGGELIEGNIIVDCSAPWSGAGMAIDSANPNPAIVRGNAIVNSGVGFVINFRTQGRVHLYNNIAADVGTLGQILRFAQQNIVAHNVTARNGVAGLSIEGETRLNSFLNNIYFDSRPQHLYRNEYFGSFNGSELQNTLDYCLFDPESIFATPLDWFTPWIGSHQIHADPQFIDADRNDFRLRQESPARGASAAVALLGALPYPDLGIFSAEFYWQPDLKPVPETTVNEGQEVRIPLELQTVNPSSSKLVFELVDPPAGAQIDATTGLFTWTPSEEQGPGTYDITVLTTADDSPLVSALTRFRIRVEEVNLPPVFGPIPDQTIALGTSLEMNLGNPHRGGAAGLTLEIYRDIGGNTIADLLAAPKFPNQPDFTGLLTGTVETPRGAGENYGQRLRGFLRPPLTGDYTFWISSDDNSALFLSSNPLEADKQLIAWVNGATGYRQWASEPNQKSNPIHLEAGAEYYLEIVMKEGCCDDHLTVRWQMPNGELEVPISAAHLVHWSEGIGVALEDGDVPRQRLQFSLNNAPAGATIDSDSGILRWHPDAQTAYGSYLLEVQVTDSGDAAQSATRQFRVAVVPPLVISAETRGNANGLTLTFASPVEPSLALDPGHYGIDHGIQILSATLLTPTHVRLETSPIPEGNVYTLTVKAVPDANNPGQMIAPDYQLRFLQTQGAITRQEFHNLGGGLLSDLTNSARFPDSPDVSVLAPSLETPVNVRDNYGVRFAGYLTPPTTGEYTFFVSSDDQSAFFLSTDESPANKALIAFEPAWNESRQWIMGVNQAPRIPAAHPPEFFAGALFIEGEDFDFDHGQSITDQPIGMNGAYAGGAYQGLGSAADAEIDWHETNPSNDQAVYRPSTAVEAAKPNGPAGHDRGEFDVQINHVVGWSDAGDWYNYTRVFPETARDYYVLARLSSGGAPIAADLSEVISGRGTENQTLTKLGEFRSPATGNWDVFAFVPLTDSSGNFVKLNFTGQRTLRFTTLPGNLDLDYLMFKPVVNGPSDLEQLRPVNQSLPIHLEAGRKYYLEGLMKEGGGGDNFGVAWVKPGDPPLKNGDPPIPGRYLTGLAPSEPVTIVSQPQNQTADEFGEATFSVVVNGTPPFDYQWYRDDVPLPGENGPSLALENVSPADHNRVFRVEIFNGISFLRSADATLSINADLQPPTIAAIEGSATLDRVKILFSEPIDPADALDIANYQIDGLTVTSARLLSDGRRVVLSTSAHTPGALYTLTVNRIRDVAAARNPVAAGTQASLHGFVFSSGFLRREIFTGFGGTRIADLRAHDGYPDSPNAVDYVTEFESPGAGLDEYGVRLSGFLTVPVTGEYVFYLCSDDEGILYLSTDESPANKVQIGLEPAWNPPRQWMNSLNQPTRGNPPSNVSGPIALETGRRYYVEALMKEGGGADHIEVAWQMPGNGIPQNGSPPIPGAYLGAFANPDDASITILRQPVAATVLDGESATFEVRAASSKQPRYYQWQRNEQNILGANSSSYTTPPAQLADSGAKFRCLISIPGATVVSEAVELTVSADQKPPALVAVEGNIGFDRIIVRFSEPVDPADATNAENYQLSGGLSVQEARLKPDGRTVELITSTQAEGLEYVLSVRGIRDVSTARNPVADGTNMRFRAWQPEEFVGPFPSWADVKRDYGAVGDGLADDTDALQKALDEFGASDRPMPNPARVLYIPAGTYRITRTLNYATRIGSSVVGEAPDTTILKWDGQDNGVMLWANGVTLARMGRLTFDGSGRAQSGINHKWDQQRLFSTTGNEYADMCFKDLQFGIKAGIAANDAEVAVLRCRFIRCSVMGISIESFNALDWWVWHSLFEDCAVAVGNTYGAGHIHVYDSLFRRSTVSDVAVGNTSYFSFRRNTSVQSKTFLTQVFTLNPCQYTIQDNIIIDPIDPSPISINSFGPILLLDNWIRVRPENESSPSIIAGQASVISIGNHFNAANPFQVDRLASVDDQIVPAAAMNFVEPALPGPLPNRHRRIFEVAPGATAEQIQAAVDQAALESGTRPVVHLPAADYFIDRTIVIPANSDIQLVGDGYEASTRLRWTGAGSGPVLRLAGPSKAALREFSIYAGDRARGIDLDNADQPGARVAMDQAYFVANQDGNLVVDRLDETDVTLHNSNHVSAGRNASVRVVGGPKRAAGLASNSRFALFGGSSADNYLSYDVAQGARVMVQDTWYEGQPPRFLKLTGSGSFTLNGATVAAADPGHQGTPGLEPAIELHDFHGDVALLNFLLPVRSSGITLSGDNTNLNLFFAGMASWPQPMTDNSPGARWAGIGNIIGEPGAWWTRAQDQGQWDAEFLRLMFAPLRNEKPRPIAPKIEGVTDARIFRLFIAQGTIGMQISGLNVAPVLDAIADLTVVEGQAVSIQAEAVDQDQPFQTLSFQLDGTVPVGAAIHSASGLFTWTPSEDQGPGEYVINVRVTDNGSPALSDTKSFKINVTELNTAPRIGVIGSITNRLLTAFVDIGVPGDPAVNGSTTMPGDGSFEVIAGGSDIWGNSDRFHFAYQEVTGDFDLRVQVESLEAVSTFTKAGLMARESLDPGSRNLNVVVNPKGATLDGGQGANQYEVHQRNVTDGQTDSWPNVTGAAGVNYPNAWIRLRRQGNIFTAFRSNNGLSWAQLARQTVNYPQTMFIGLCTSAVNNNPDRPAHAQYRNYLNIYSGLVPISDANINEFFGLALAVKGNDDDLPPQTLTYSLDNGAPANATIDPVSGAFNWVPDESQGPGTYAITVRVTDDGTPPLSAAQTFSVVVNEVNSAPILEAIAPQSVIEGQEFILAPAASDLDLPANNFKFALGNDAPAGMVIDEITGVIRWIPAEEQGPAALSIRVSVSDDGVPSFTDAKVFSLSVLEDNTPPTLESVGDKSINEGMLLTFTALAADADLPKQGLKFGFADAVPGGATIDENTGVFRWTPTELQGPGVYAMAITVTDNSTPALSATNEFKVTVLETNSPPVLPVLAVQRGTEGETFTLQLQAIDPDVPINGIQFALLEAPPTATLDAQTGMFSWTPGEADGPGTNRIQVVLLDDGVPPMSSTNEFTLIIAETNSPPVFTVVDQQTIAEGQTLTVPLPASDADLPVNQLTFKLLAGPAGSSVNAQSGDFTWTPGEADGPGSHEVTVTVSDNGIPILSATNKFTVKVTEVNTAPELGHIGPTTNAMLVASLDLGTPLDPIEKGSTTRNEDGSVLMIAGGSDLFGTVDHGHFAYQEITGDFDVVVRVESLQATAIFAKAGLMMRESLNANSRNLKVVVNPRGTVPGGAQAANQYEVHQRNITGGSTVNWPNITGAAGVNYPNAWIRLRRQGSIFTAYRGNNGSTWTQLARLSANYPEKVFVGLCASSVNNTAGNATQAKFQNYAATYSGFTFVPDQSVVEGQTLNLTWLARDADLPAQKLTFQLGDGSPEGVTIDSITGAWSWTPGEGQAPGEFPITVHVIDDGDPTLEASQTFLVRVSEENRAPTLAGIDNVAINETELLSLTLSASDPDLPSNVLSFSIDSGFLAGMNLDANTGLFEWTPTEAQGPGVYPVTVRVTDNGSPALHDTKQFTITLNEVNEQPILDPINQQTVNEGVALSLRATVTDPDLPKQNVLFSFGAKTLAGATIDALTGLFRWTPAEIDGPGRHEVEIVATDNGNPPLSSTNLFAIEVNEINSAPVIEPISLQTITEGSAIELEIKAQDPDIPANNISLALAAAPPGATLDSATGKFQWTTTEADGPSTNIIKVVATDDGTPALSRTNEFSIVVLEVNTPPVFEPIEIPSVVEGETLNAQLKAIDLDLPPNVIIYLLGSGPAGSKVDARTGVFTWVPEETDGPGTHKITVVAVDSGQPLARATNEFTVTVLEGNRPPVASVLPLQTAIESKLVQVQLAGTDPDVPANKLSFSLLEGPPTATVDPVTGIFEWVPGETDAPATNTYKFVVTDDGVPPLSGTNEFTVVILETNSAPVFEAMEVQTVIEGETLSVPVKVIDPDVPANLLIHLLASGPTGSKIDARTGVFTWKPGETDGPGTHKVTVVAVDNGVPSMRATNEFTVAVIEANSPPIASVLPLQTAIESKLVQVQLAGTDPDVPANKLSFSLLEGPPTATVDPVTGIFEWVPGETDAPATNTYKFVVTDDGVPPLSGTNEFTVVILETNSAPVFEAMDMQTVIEGETLSVPVKVIDPDVPANLLIHLLASGPTGSKIDARTGVFTWKPGEADGPGTHKITVVAVDNGVPSMRATNEFTVAVLEANSPPVALAVTEQTVAEGQTLRVTLRATDSDLPVNELSFALIDPLPEAEVDPKSGMFTWTPAEAHGPGLHQFTFVVTDNGEPAMSATNQFSVNVLETNDAPAFEPTPPQTVIEGETLTVSVAASDSDLPANVLAYSLALAPPGAAIDARNGLFTWTPTETDGPSTKQVRVIVVDNGQPSLKATNEFSIQVLETNLPPVLLPIAEQTIIEGQPFRLQMMASDADRPANKLTFLLQTAPASAALDPNSGLLTWNPTETDGPGSNQFIVVVNDNGDPSLSATNEFIVIVLETNSPPILESVLPQAVLAGEELVVELKGSDPDVPLQQIRFALEPDAAEGATLDAVTGQFRWTPPITHPTANREFVVRLTDDGVPPMSVTTRFQVAVTGRAVRIVDLAFRGLDSITFSWPVEAGKTYRVESNDTLDPSQWKEAAGQTTIAGGMANFVETLGATTYRFYRVVTLTP